jgi:signal recognition particle receptor subunit beta
VSSVNLHTREIAFKVVYYGPGLGGKTSSLSFIHRALKPDSRGQLVSLATGVDRTLYFDFLPIKLPRLRGFAVRVQLYTVPGQVHYNSTRKLVLSGADGVVFVADSQRARAAANLESMDNLVENLAEQGLTLRSLPVVLQLNKRDAPDAMPAGEMEKALNGAGGPVFESVATRGAGVFDALKAATGLVLAELRKRSAPPAAAASPPPAAAGPGEVADAFEQLEAREGRGSGPHRIAAREPARDLSDLVAPGQVRDHLDAVEGLLDRGDYAGAVRLAAQAFRELAARVVGVAATGGDEPGAVAALLTGLPASRYLRFREIAGRVEQEGAVASTDALFALFFLTDCALRAEELRHMPPWRP